jgi:arylsulfatase A-like enzyme
LRGYKGQLYEGGIRIPFLVQWKRHIPSGKVCDEPVIAVDILPTAIAAAGGTLTESAKIDGVNLLPFLSETKTQPPHEALYWRYGVQSAIRRGKWKLLNDGKKPAQLFDLIADISETNNSADQHPDLVNELSMALKQWESLLAAPLWPSPNE